MKKFFSGVIIVMLIIATVFVLQKKYHLFGILGIEQMTEEREKEFITRLHDGIMKGEKEIVLEYLGSPDTVEDFVTEALDKAMELDDKSTSSDYDYMKFKQKATYMNMKGYGSYYIVTYKMEYLETYEQTQEVEKKVQEILKELKLDNKSEYKKVKAIHDYIVEHVTYDLSTEKNTAYTALTDQISACQGYATLLYKMLTDAGIECRIIGGSTDGTPHAWNIVKVDGAWYNVDCTWDDPIGGGTKERYRYDYFLKSNRAFADHIRDAEYDTEEFNQEYVISPTSYKIK